MLYIYDEYSPSEIAHRSFSLQRVDKEQLLQKMRQSS